MTHIDTAEMYGSAEKLIGEAIMEWRDEVFLVSKVLPSNATRGGTIAACARSLARPKTDHLDCYLLHWRGSHPLEDTIARFEQLEHEGRILSWGVSNFDVPDLEDAWRIAGPGRMACNQFLYHLKERASRARRAPLVSQAPRISGRLQPIRSSNCLQPRTSGGRVLAEVAAAHDTTPARPHTKTDSIEHEAIFIKRTRDHENQSCKAGHSHWDSIILGLRLPCY
jgi:diketogulonate reductase-like aldo/keto reductase